MSHLLHFAMCDTCGDSSASTVRMTVHGNEVDTCRDCFVDRWLWPMGDDPQPEPDPQPESGAELPLPVADIMDYLREKFPDVTFAYVNPD